MTAVAPIISMQVNMPPEIGAMYERLINETERIAGEQPDPVIAVEACASVAAQTVLALKILVLQQGFADKAAEILFFKYIKPRFYGRLLFYQALYQFESQKPAAGPGLKKYIKRKLKLLSEYLADHRELYLYLRQGKTHLDT